MGIINARMSERSFRSWQKHPRMIGAMLGSFDIVFAQSEQDASRLQTLGARDVVSAGNLKYDGATLPCDEEELITLQNAIGARPVWLAASTHPGEEEIIAQAHQLISSAYPDLLTIIVPRHPERGGAIAEQLKKYGRPDIALAQKDPITDDTGIYIADTLGELGLFYRLSEIVFMGGSLVKHGGQNPLEPARLTCAVITGPHTHNFSDIYNEMEQAGGCVRVDNAKELAAQIGRLLDNAAARNSMQDTVREWMENKGGATERILNTGNSIRSQTPARKRAKA